MCPTHPPYTFDPEESDSWNHIYGVPMNNDSGVASTLADPALERVSDGVSTGWSSRELYLSRLEAPSDYVLLADSILTSEPTDETAQSRTAWDDGQFSMVHARHNGNIQAAMADGSAVSLTPQEYAGHRARALNLQTYSVTYFGPEGKAEATWSR